MTGIYGLQPPAFRSYLARPTPNTPQWNGVRGEYFDKQHPGVRIFFPTGLELMRVPAAEVMHLFRSLPASRWRNSKRAP